MRIIAAVLMVGLALQGAAIPTPSSTVSGRFFSDS